MILTLKYFGVVAEATACIHEEFSLPTPCTVADLEQLLRQRYPKLSEISFRMAVNRAFVNAQQWLQLGDEVALLPPFAGG